MSKEDRLNQMEQLFKRGTELVDLGRQQLDPATGLTLLSYQKYKVIINSRTFNIAKVITLQKWSPTFEDLNSFIIKFFPEDQDKLKIKKGVEDPELPTFSVHNGSSGYDGSLEYLKKHIIRTDPWSKLIDVLSNQFKVEYVVGSNRGADRILSNLIKRLSDEPETIKPVNPESWKDMAEKRNRFQKPPIF